MALAVAGNMLPIVPLFYALRLGPVQALLKPVLNRAQKKTAEFVESPSKQSLLLAAFVGVPLPGTGAWTGAMVAYIIGMKPTSALTSIFAGVVSAAAIMSAVSVAGYKVGSCKH